LTKMTLRGKPKLFGGSVLTGVTKSQFRVPEVCYLCIEYLRKTGLSSEGLFRVPGNNDTIQKLKMQFEKHESIELSDPHDAAGLLKLYIRQLSSPLIPHSLYSQFVELEDKSKSDKMPADQKGAKYKALEAQIPAANRDVLTYLTRFLVDMAKHASETKMDVNNIAMVFAPNILRPEVDTQQSLVGDAPRTIECTKYLIVNAYTLFSAPPDTDWRVKA